MYYKSYYKSPVGLYTLASDGKNLTGVWLEGQKYFCTDISKMAENSGLDIFRQTSNWLDRYFRGEKPDINELSLSPEGNAFRQQVWQILCKIPYGKTMTYGEIASIIARKRGLARMSAQAVGGAVGHNPISIIIPCHRVVGSNGSFTGYAGGIQTKIRLLKLEGVNMSNLFIPKKSQAY